jgi:hypothetical protein
MSNSTQELLEGNAGKLKCYKASSYYIPLLRI